jgi:tRNA threonylcarbamoyladenosine biosynthesis protein TsaE
VDLYRITEPEELEDIGFDEVAGGENVAAVEWVERLPEGSLGEDIFIRIQVTGDESRLFSLFFYGRRFYNLVGELQKFQST